MHIIGDKQNGVLRGRHMLKPWHYVIQMMTPEDAPMGTSPDKIRQVPYWYAGLAPMPEEYKIAAIAPLWSPYASDVLGFENIPKAKIEADALAKDGLFKFQIIMVTVSKLADAWPDPK